MQQQTYFHSQFDFVTNLVKYVSSDSILYFGDIKKNVTYELKIDVYTGNPRNLDTKQNFYEFCHLGPHKHVNPIMDTQQYSVFKNTTINKSKVIKYVLHFYVTC